MYLKNTSSQEVYAYARSALTNAAATALTLAGNMQDNDGNTTSLVGRWSEVSDANMPGWYKLTLSDTETNCETLVICPTTATSGILIDQFTITLWPEFVSDASMQAELEAIQAKTNLIGATSYTITSPVVDGDALVIYAGMDYVDTAAIVFTKTNYGGLDLAGGEVYLRLSTAAHWQSSTNDPDYEIEGTLAIDGTTVSATVEIPADTIAVGSYHYQVLAFTGSLDRVVLADGSATITKTLEQGGS